MHANFLVVLSIGVTMKMLWMMLSLLAGCHAGQDQPASQFLAFRELPANYEKSAPPHSLVLRTDIKVRVCYVFLL